MKQGEEKCPVLNNCSSFPVEDSSRGIRLEVPKVNGFIVYSRQKKSSSVSYGVSEDETVDIVVENEVNVDLDDGEPLSALNSSLTLKSAAALLKENFQNVLFQEKISCESPESDDPSNRKRRKKVNETMNGDEIVTVPIEVLVNGFEAFDGEAVSELEVEIIDAEGNELPKKNLELKMSKKISLANVPMTVKELFETGLLEGVPVVYMGGKKFQGFGLRGTIKDAGILCSCSLCKGCRVIPPSQFEIHAINQYRRAGQYICFENGKSLLDLLNACRTCRLDSLKSTIENAISGLPIKRNFTCKRCKGCFPVNFVGKIGPLCNSCLDIKGNDGDSSCVGVSSIEPIPTSESTKTALVSAFFQDSSDMCAPQESEIKQSKKNSSKNASSHKPLNKKTLFTSKIKSIKMGMIDKIASSSTELSSSFNKKRPKLVSRYQWKITKKDQRLHKSVFEEGGLSDGSELAYYARGQKLLVGYKRGSGILCNCCNSEVSPSTFEAHAGWATRKKPYAYIYTSNGVSLHEHAIILSKRHKHSSNEDDDLCVVCFKSGNLIPCDGCPRAFHKECASLPTFQHNDGRYCSYCQNAFNKDRYVHNNEKNISERCIRIVINSDAQYSACALCRGHDFSRSGFGPRTIILCNQCEKEFHVGCLRTHKIANLKELPKAKWFCCTDCTNIHSSLQTIVNRGNLNLPVSFLDSLKMEHKAKFFESNGDLDVRLQLVSGRSSSPETKLLLSQALTIFQDCFDPIIDPSNGRDLIPLMVFGENSKGQDFGGMYCAILSVKSIIQSAGIFRIFGSEVAEIPLVGSGNPNHAMGYFNMLFCCIEKLLSLLNVQRVVLPAAKDEEIIWIGEYGFEKVRPEQLDKYRKSCCQMVDFKDTSILGKDVPSFDHDSLHFLDFF